MPLNQNTVVVVEEAQYRIRRLPIRWFTWELNDSRYASIMHWWSMPVFTKNSSVRTVPERLYERHHQRRSGIRMETGDSLARNADWYDFDPGARRPEAEFLVQLSEPQPQRPRW